MRDAEPSKTTSELAAEGKRFTERFGAALDEIYRRKARTMKFTINGQSFETPLIVEGETDDLLWLGTMLADRTRRWAASAEGSWSSVSIETDDDYERERIATEKRHEDWLLEKAEAIRKKRDAAGFTS